MRMFIDSYRSDDLDRFETDSLLYLKCNTKKKSMGGLCEFLKISRQTLSKYKHRNKEWSDTINKVKLYIEMFNLFGIRGEVDISDDKINDVIENVDNIVDLSTYNEESESKEEYDSEYDEEYDSETDEEQDKEKTREQLKEEYEKQGFEYNVDESGEEYFIDGDGNLYYLDI